MNLPSIALKNLKRNFSFYSLYLFSVSFVLMIFFCFISFSKNIVIMKKISSDGRVETMCQAVAVFVMAFVIFYMSYSNKFFMHRRMKELGVYALLGYRKSAMLLLLTFENIIICLGSLAVGILTGGILHKLLSSGIINLLKLSINKSQIPLYNLAAIRFSTVFVVMVLIALTLSNAKLLWKSTLLELVRLEKKNEKPVKVRVSLGLFGIIALFAGYGLAVDITRGKSSLWYSIGFSPIALFTLLCVVFGTIFFIYSFLPLACSRIKKHKNNFYKETTIIVVPKFMHRIRSNAKSLILLILLSAATLSILGSTILSTWYPIEALERIIPSAIEYRTANMKQTKNTLEALDKAIGKDKYQAHITKIIKVKAKSSKLPFEYSISKDKGRTPGFECISESDYSTLLSSQGKKSKLKPLTNSSCVLIKYRPDKTKSDLGSIYKLYLGNGAAVAVKVKQTSLVNPIGFSNSVGTLIISDELYYKMLSYSKKTINVVSINGRNMRTNKAAYNALHKAMPDNIYLVSAYERRAELLHDNSSTLLLICFATIIFLIATGSILYFQNISSISYDKADYEIMDKMGYSKSMIKRCVRRQVQIYFLIPYIIGMLHSIFALICYKSALMDDLLGRNSAVILPIAFSIGLFSIIYFIYYQLTKHSCYKIAID